MDTSDDAVLVINSEGIIMVANEGIVRMFGYTKAELEGANVNMLMPPPFSQRHSGYLQRYAATGEAHILDEVAEVVAMHKDHFVFPINMCVTKLSGGRGDAIFLGLLRHVPPSVTDVRVWTTLGGSVLVADQQFCSLCGVPQSFLIGRRFPSLVTDCAAAEAFLRRCHDATAEVTRAGSITAAFSIVHEYSEPVNVEVTVRLAGSDAQRILVFCMRRLDGKAGTMLVTDGQLRVKFATWDVGILLGYSLTELESMRLEDLLPPPFSTLHTRWGRNMHPAPPAFGCRSGVVVHMLSSAGAQVPVRIEVNGRETSRGAVQHVVKVTKAGPKEFLEEKCTVITIDFSGRVVAVSSPTTALFGFRAACMAGASVCDFIDVFTDWRNKNGDGSLQMLLLALLDWEQRMPGASWRVGVNQPPDDGDHHASSVVPLPAIKGAAPAEFMHAVKTARVMACMQVELDDSGHEGSEGKAGGGVIEGSAIRLVLWRRDLLTGLLELDSQLNIRRADVQTGLILGVSPTVLARQSLHDVLDLPFGALTWEELMGKEGHRAKRGALKGHKANPDGTGSVRPAISISAQRAFTGSHPDGGTMRIFVQGVQVEGPNGAAKVQVTFHPDTAFKGAHVDLIKALHMEAALAAAHHGSGEGDAAAGAHTAAGGGDGKRAEVAGQSGDVGPHKPSALMPQRSALRRATDHSAEAGKGAVAFDVDHHASQLGDGIKSGSDDDSDDDDSDSDDGPGPQPPEDRGLYSRGGRSSEFVEQWVHTVSRQATAAPQGIPGLPTVPAGEDERVDPSDITPQVVDRPESPAAPCKPPEPSKGARKAAKRSEVEADDDEEVCKPGKNRDAGMDDASSNGSASQASASIGGASSATAATTADEELVVDVRRERLLKALHRTLLGPVLAEPLTRMQMHTLGLLAVMLVAHIACYVFFKGLVAKEHANIYLVRDQAFAMDRGQLILNRVIEASFCAIPGIKNVSGCSLPLDSTMALLRSNVDELEAYHQAVYLGISKIEKLKDTRSYEYFTYPTVNYTINMDGSGPGDHAPSVSTGVWQYVNRFIAAAREALYWLPVLGPGYMGHRTFGFILGSAAGPLFDSGAVALDYLVNATWTSLTKLRTALIALFVVEALVVQLCCLTYQWSLVKRLERARLVGLAAMLGLPGPVLRKMTAANCDEIIRDEDEEEDDGNAGVDHADQQQQQQQRPESKHGYLRHRSVGKRLDWQEPADNSTITGNQDKDTDMDDRSKLGVAEVPKDDGEGSTRQKSTDQQSVAKGRSAERSDLVVNGKRLIPTMWNVARFMVPFLAWNIALVTVYGVTLYKLQDMQGPLASLNMACHVVYRYTRVSGIAFAMVTLDIHARPALQMLTLMEVKNLQSEYDALMYGGLASTQANSVFRHPVPASAFESASFARTFFRAKGCQRFDKTQCLPVDSPYYEVTHNGLDAMMRRAITELELMTADDPGDLAYDSSRSDYMAVVGRHDLYEGLQQAAGLFVDYSISRYESVQNFHTILLVATVLLVLSYIVFMLQPHMARVREEARRQSGMLSHVPDTDMDVRGYVRAVLKQLSTAATAKKSEIAKSAGGEVAGIKDNGTDRGGDLSSGIGVVPRTFHSESNASGSAVSY
ncbi:hypothetical protein Agub_g11721 [Astrephomene gubernaculifera]|uniref:PAS domain-containing protein n=1 Tax=Astrephomene gubernaculifera TaxID=47775 RepID=A0AAD3DZN2_9CHLO|nr:hypothetical protein Agub_g11721 [Astrephomene gubernaculifera]